MTLVESLVLGGILAIVILLVLVRRCFRNKPDSDDSIGEVVQSNLPKRSVISKYTKRASASK